MSMARYCRCDACGRTTPIDDDTDDEDGAQPDGWLWLKPACGDGLDACSTACALSLLKEHADHPRHDGTIPRTDRPS